MRFRKVRFGALSIDDWELSDGQTWCLLGGNASGKSQLAALAAGERDPEEGCILDRPARARLVSFEEEQARYERELKNDDTDYLDRIDAGTTVLQLLAESGRGEKRARELAEAFGLGYALDRGYRLLSSGEARKALLMREILSEPELLVLDEPFEGLDVRSRADLVSLCERLKERGYRLLLIVNRMEDVVPWATHLAVLQRGSLLLQGPRAEVEGRPELAHLMEFHKETLPPLPPAPLREKGDGFERLVRLRQGRVAYGDTAQFEGLDWELRAGEHTLIAGPNGCGKSTLLQLLTGDHPQCYSNELEVFGIRRGSGESIWDIKRNIGLVSPALHRDYRVSCNTLTVALSGLFDSIGLYQPVSQDDKSLAMAWLAAMGLAEQANVGFRQLSWGQQRLALIARGLIKQPPLLILDEPTQGLDDLNRHLVLAFVERLASVSGTTVLFVSHRADERLELFRRELRFHPSSKEGVRYWVELRDS